MEYADEVSPGGKFDIIQAAFSISLFSNVAHNIIRSTPKQLTFWLSNRIEARLSDDIDDLGSWQVVWGPVVLVEDDSGTIDNAMYVAYNAACDYHVVGVAATNPSSLYDIFVLDLGVDQTRPFPQGITPAGCAASGAASAGNLSEGTALGITNLLEMVDDSLPGSPNLQAFLKGVAGADSTLVVAGHSLGAALAPALAFWLYPQPEASGWKAVYVLPTAGASPGDAAFAAGFAKAFPAVRVPGVNNPDYGLWNSLFWNQYDVVPHSWTNILGVQPGSAANDILWGVDQSLYGALSAKAWGDVELIVRELHARPGANRYARLDDHMFVSDYVPSEVTDLQTFEHIAGEQHVVAYGAYFQVPVSQQVAIGISLLSARAAEPDAD